MLQWKWVGEGAVEAESLMILFVYHPQTKLNEGSRWGQGKLPDSTWKKRACDQSTHNKGQKKNIKAAKSLFYLQRGSIQLLVNVAWLVVLGQALNIAVM